MCGLIAANFGQFLTIGSALVTMAATVMIWYATDQYAKTAAKQLEAMNGALKSQEEALKRTDEQIAIARATLSENQSAFKISNRAWLAFKIVDGSIEESSGNWISCELTIENLGNVPATVTAVACLAGHFDPDNAQHLHLMHSEPVLPLVVPQGKSASQAVQQELIDLGDVVTKWYTRIFGFIEYTDGLGVKGRTDFRIVSKRGEPYARAAGHNRME